MNSTIDYYNRNADVFFNGTINADMSECRKIFLKWLDKAGGKFILDAGCGSGRDTLSFIEDGYEVEAFDASEEICKRASEYCKINVKCMTFDEMDFLEKYDGIWACASLLHVKIQELPKVIGKCRKALKKKGVMYASFKYGSGEKNVNGRFFCYMDEKEIRELFEKNGFVINELFITKDVRPNRTEQWVNVVASCEG